MAPDAVSQINRPGQRRWRAISVIRQSCEQTAEAANHDANADRKDERASGRASNAAPPFPDFHRNDTAGQRTADAMRGRDQRAPQAVGRSEQPCAGQCADRQCQEVAGPGQVSEGFAVGRPSTMLPAGRRHGAHPRERIPDIVSPWRGRYDDHPRSISIHGRFWEMDRSRPMIDMDPLPTARSMTCEKPVRCATSG